MPTYDYICDSCGHEFEAFESIKADPQKICPTCHAETLRRKIGAGAAILFKGSGFYQTDYRSESYKKSAAADKPAEFVVVFLLVLDVVALLDADSGTGTGQVRGTEALGEWVGLMIRGRCPICSKAFEIAALGDLPSFPFCSERCRLIDLGRWIDGAYAVPSEQIPEPTEGETLAEEDEGD